MLQMILGPILGLVGSGVEKFYEYKQERLQMEQEDQRHQHQVAVMRLEGEQAERQLRVEGEVAQQKADMAAFQKSYDFGTDVLLPADAKLTPGQLNWIVAVEVFSKAIRPLSTTWYQFLVALIFGWAAWKVSAAGEQIMKAEEVSSLVKELVFSIIGMAETCLFWWFGIRRMSKTKGAS